MRDHGGNLDEAMATHGGAPGDWLDLSTGINPEPYPVPDLPHRAWTALPTRRDQAALAATAAATYRTTLTAVPLAGAQAAIQLVPRIAPAEGTARVLGPTYNEHAAALYEAGRPVDAVARLDALEGAGVAVVVNPNNPDGRCHTPETLERLARQVGLLVVDESFADPCPELSLAPLTRADNVVILRSFGKFYGLAGLRLGFALARPRLAERIAALAGPWAVSGPAIAIGGAALADTGWQADTIARLDRDAARLDALAAASGWHPVGGTTLFRCYDTGGAARAQTSLARHKVWSRIFPYDSRWLRLGLPPRSGWAQLEAALGAAR